LRWQIDNIGSRRIHISRWRHCGSGRQHAG
jgi:hypothetical protein